MRTPKIQDFEMLERLMTVFRAKGYDGASLTELAAASGLKKASLYHRFPNGKKEMAAAVLDFAADWVNEHIHKNLTDSQLKPAQRLEKALSSLDKLYKQGSARCIHRALSMESGMHLFGEQINQGMQKYIEAFTVLGVDLNLGKTEAHALAVQSLIDIQGSLVVSQGLKNNEIFQSALENIRKRYLND